METFKEKVINQSFSVDIYYLITDKGFWMFTVLIVCLIVYSIGLYHLIKGRSKEAVLLLFLNTFTLGVAFFLLG